MASILVHPFVALGLASFLRRRGMSGRLLAVGALCTIVPDADVFGFWLGVPYDAVLGHRGFTHSLVFAALLAGLLASARRWLSPHASGATVFGFLFLCTASHGVLDAATDGGLGIALLSPFSNERYFLPWRPIAVSPLSVTGFFTARGQAVLATEFVWVVLPSLALGAFGWVLNLKHAKARVHVPD